MGDKQRSVSNLHREVGILWANLLKPFNLKYYQQILIAIHKKLSNCLCQILVLQQKSRSKTEVDVRRQNSSHKQTRCS